MNIIVTGGAGFIGSNFIFHMLKKYPDYRIICLDCLTYAGNLSTLAPVMDNPNFRFVKESITDREAVYKLFEEEHPDMVVNFAAESHVDRSIENPEVFLDTNIKGTAVLPVNFTLMLRQHIRATGRFKTTSAKDVETVNPYSSAIRSIKIASPVNPLDRRPAGRIKARIT